MHVARSESVEIPSCQNLRGAGQRMLGILLESWAQRSGGSGKAFSSVESGPSELAWDFAYRRRSIPFGN